MSEPVTEPAAAPTRHAAPRLAELVAVLAKDANLTFGGGSATIAVLREQVVVQRGWITELEFRLAYALSRLTPGTNLLAFCTSVGWLARGWRGALVALLAASTPCAVIAALATHFYAVLEQSVLFRMALRGALAAAVAVMVNTAWILARPYAALRLRPIAIVVGAIALTVVASFSPFQVLVTAAAVGALWPTKEARP